MSYYKSLVFLPIAIFVIGILVFPNASGIVYNHSNGTYLSKSHLIGIQLSQVCLSMIQHNITNHCITYDKIKYLDNTNSLFSGKWVDTPYYHRLAPRVANHYNFNPNNFIVMVDPNPDFQIRAKMIVIQSNNFTWINPDDIVTNHTRIEHVNRYVSTCAYITVAPNIFIINDTVHYLESGCKDTKYNDVVKIEMKSNPFDFNSPYSSLKYKNQIADLKKNPVANCLQHKCKPTKNIYSNW